VDALYQLSALQDSEAQKNSLSCVTLLGQMYAVIKSKQMDSSSSDYFSRWEEVKCILEFSNSPGCCAFCA
jgi:hypothetical protein